ncbi:MAG: amidohydrolase family protein [Sediminibacterium sp.]|jgi:predicted amidohydrolase YtcJ|nr:amidohydrolase family protein [Sediminibacterium sp.]
MRHLLAIAIVFLFSSCINQRVDLIVHHAQIFTVNNEFSVAEAMAIQDGKIVAIGNNDDILKAYKSDSVVNANGASVYPGFIDAHAHFLGYGQSLYTVDLMFVPTWAEAIARVKDFAAKHPGTGWIKGRGWDQNRFPGKQFPTNALLNELFPDRPVILERVDGHASIANDFALKLAGVKPGQTMEGGQFLMQDGKLTGLLVDNAVSVVDKMMPPVTKEDYKNWLISAQQNCFATGLTTITDCGLSPADIDHLDALQKSNDLKMRLYVMLSDKPESYSSKYYTNGGYVTDRLSVKGIKVYSDGALGSRGACLLQHYADKADWSGFLLSSQAHFDSLAAQLINTDFQMCTHAIGDSANRTILNVYAKYLKGKNDKRWRIEHAQIIHPSDFHLFGENSIVPSVQPTHATSDMYWAGDRLGAERLKGGYAFKQLLDENGWLPLGTDFPVEEINPFKTFLASVARQDSKGFPAGGFQIENALTREQTIRGMTIWAAKANRMEKQVGSLEIGKKADFIILDKNLMIVPADSILQIKVKRTYLNGERVH